MCFISCSELGSCNKRGNGLEAGVSTFWCGETRCKVLAKGSFPSVFGVGPRLSEVWGHADWRDESQTTLEGALTSVRNIPRRFWLACYSLYEGTNFKVHFSWLISCTASDGDLFTQKCVVSVSALWLHEPSSPAEGVRALV